jgi:DME family drug/metabolite transporter
LVVAACTVGWGLTGVFGRELEHLPPLVTVFFRMLFALPFIGIFALVVRGPKAFRPPSLATYMIGGILALHLVLFFSALQRTTAASASLVTNLAPVFIALLAPFLLSERLRKTTVVALALALAGTTVITIWSQEVSVDPIGILLALGAALSAALLIISTKKFTDGVDPVQFILHETIAAVVLLSPAAFVYEYSFTTEETVKIAALGLLFTGVTGVLFIWAIQKITATTAGILSQLEPVFTAILAAILIGEAITGSLLLGGITIIAAGTVVIVAHGRAEKAAASQTADAELAYVARSEAPARLPGS